MQLSTALKQLLGKTDLERRIGPFRLVRPLGRGGEAPVWLAREVYGETELRLAAVKLFAFASRDTDVPGSRSSTQRHRSHVVEEAKALCRVEHPNIVRFYSIATDDVQGLIGVAMEYLTGTSLEARIESRGPLPMEELLAVGAAVASALSAVHRAGLVHRDVKPANIVDSSGTFKLIDFGIAWEDAPPEGTMPVLVDDLPLEIPIAERGQIPGAVTIRRLPSSLRSGSSSLSAPRAPSGTMGYIDPACLRTFEAATAASDLFALGVVLFECATGVHPAALAAGSGQGLRQEVLDGRERAPSLATSTTGLPSALCALVDALLDPDPAARPASADGVALELERIRGEAAGTRRVLPPESVGPFRGLARFEADDRDVYFGRSSEIASAVDRLRQNALVALVGPSGSGKSSLARAGVVPRVREGALGRGLEAWDVVVVAPGPDPRGAILAGLRASVPDLPLAGPGPAATDVAAALAERAEITRRGTLVVVDQLEELVTLADPSAAASRGWAAELLVAIAQTAAPGVRALVTARRDLLDPLLSFEGLGRMLVRGTMLVDPMAASTWLDVVQQALGAYGYTLEDDALAETLREQLRATSEAMPLVQFALTELWQQRDPESRRITHAGLAAIGGLSGSLERHATRTVVAIARRDAEATPVVRALLLAMTTPQGTRAAADVTELVAGDGRRREVLAALEEARLVVREGDAVTIAHDVLLTQWNRLRLWLDEVREERLLAEELERDAARWASDRDGAGLWGKRRVAAAREILASARLSPVAGRFLDASRAAQRRAQALGIGAAALAVTLAVGGAAVHVRQLRADEAAARQVAELERSKAELEVARRVELEKAQSDLATRQETIDRLMAELGKAEDARAIDELRRRMAEEQGRAHAAQQRIAAASRPTSPASAPAPAAPATTARGPKIQREDD